MAQRCLGARVWVEGRQVAGIGRGLCAFCAVASGDGAADVRYLADKLAALRVFPRGDRLRMEAGLTEVGGEILLVPNFTLFGDVRRGRRPDFGAAAPAEHGRALLGELAAALRSAGVAVQEGIFGADMRVEVDNDGPVTILLDSARLF